MRGVGGYHPAVTWGMVPAGDRRKESSRLFTHVPAEQVVDGGEEAGL